MNKKSNSTGSRSPAKRSPRRSEKTKPKTAVHSSGTGEKVGSSSGTGPSSDKKTHLGPVQSLEEACLHSKHLALLVRPALEKLSRLHSASPRIHPVVWAFSVRAEANSAELCVMREHDGAGGADAMKRAGALIVANWKMLYIIEKYLSAENTPASGAAMQKKSPKTKKKSGATSSAENPGAVMLDLSRKMHAHTQHIAKIVLAFRASKRSKISRRAGV